MGEEGLFFVGQSENSIEEYKHMLQSVGSLSGLYSDSNVPYLGYRAVENIFCEVFGAENLSRSDCSVDAAKGGIGIGIKTFLNGNGRTLQKIAEFNRDALFFREVENVASMVKELARLRNERLRATKRIHGLSKLIYHCVVREEGYLFIYEIPMGEINVDRLKLLRGRKGNVIVFKDDKNEYSFNISKSTLYQRFITNNIALKVPVKILANPFKLVEQITAGKIGGLAFAPIKKKHNHVVLPLFSSRGSRHVPERSGLNQWNAGGRKRDYSEVYIPIPAWIHNRFPDFFPSREVEFSLRLPDGNILSTKVCQDGNKALMSNPNLALGEWLLRKVMDLKEGELLTYKRLEELGLDSVVIYKEDEKEYSINFLEFGSYDIFYQENN